MSDRVDEIAAVYGVSRRELTVGQIEDYFLAQLEEEVLKKGNLWKGSLKPININNTTDNFYAEKEKVIRGMGEEEGEKGRQLAKFKKPTIEEIRAYCDERKNGIDPEAFYYFYESKGWVIGKNSPMRNWKSAVITWEQNRRGGMRPPKPKSKGFSNFEERNTDYDALFGGR